MNFLVLLTVLGYVFEKGYTQETVTCESLNSPVLEEFESKLRNGYVIKIYQGLTSVQKDSGECPNDFLAVSPDGALTVRNAFDIDDKWQTSGQTSLLCKYSFVCGGRTYAVNVIIIDENDDLPRFKANAVAVKDVNELTVPGSDIITFIGQIEDRDPDDHPNDAKLKILLVKTEPDEGAFAVSGNLGIKVNRPLDYEDPARRQYRLTLALRDTASTIGPEHTLTVNIIDGDDQPPIFTQSSYIINLKAQGTLAGKCFPAKPEILAADGDLAINADVTYAIGGGEVFAMNCSNRGEVRLLRELTDADPSTFALTIKATQVDASDRVGMSYLQVNVLRPPRMGLPAYAINVLENTPSGTVVLVVSTTDCSPSSASFTLDDKTYFELTSVSGSSAVLSIKNGVTLDYEVTRNLTLKVFATADGLPSAESTIHVDIQDVNDNTPSFNEHSYLIEVDEGETVDSKWEKTIEATDGDAGINGQIIITLDDSCQYFERLRPNVQQGIARVTVKALTSLRSDNASVPRLPDGRAIYTCDIIAEDSGTPRLSNRTKIIIYVRDVNDNMPQFNEVQNGEVKARVVVGSPAGSLVACFSATDTDQLNSNNAAIRYSISGGEDLLHIDSISGKVATRTAIIGEPKELTLQVIASDLGTPPKSSSVRLRLTIEDPEELSFEFSRSEYHVDLTENPGADQAVLAVAALLNGSSSETTQYSLRGNDVPFEVNSSSGVIAVKRPKMIDREYKGQWTFLVVANSVLAHGKSAYAMVTVNVSDVNDNEPVFKGSRNGNGDFTADVVIGTPEGGLVTCILATDADEPNSDNSLVSYSISGGDSLLSIDESTGRVTTTSLIAGGPRELVLQVTASDHGASPKNTSARLLVTVLGPKSLTFEFNSSTYRQDIPENPVTGQAVVKVAAKVNGSLSDTTRYHIIDSSLPFEINYLTGNVTVKNKEKIDYEYQHLWTFLVAAEDVQVYGRTAYTTVIVEVLDVNDNSPTFVGTLDKDGNFPADVVIGTPKGGLVACMQATDADGPNSNNSLVTYSISGDSSLSIDEFSGRVTTASFITGEPRELTYLVTATDRGVPQLSRSARLRLMVQGPQEPAFEFGSPSYQGDVRENAAAGQSVLTVSAKINGSSYNTTRYSLWDEAVPFVIDPLNGTVTVAPSATIDYEYRNVWVFLVTAKDGQAYGRTAYTTISVSVSDENDNKPQFTGVSSGRTEIAAKVLQNSPVGTLVTCVHATDNDQSNSSNSLVKYSISENEWLFIDEETGQVYIKAPIQKGSKQLTASVTAADQGSPPQSSSLTLVVTVEEAADVTLEFTYSTYFATVAEGLPPGTFVVTVSAKLNDSISATTSYFISDVQVPFEVNSTNGEVRLRTVVDREERDSWTFQVGASDSEAQGGPTYALITVLISDVNDEKPVFKGVTNERGEFEAKVLAGSPAGTIVACVGATDGDQPNSNNSLVRYSISGSGLLAIDSVTGQITTIGYIRKGSKQLTASVTAADQGSPPQNSSLTLVVTVEEAADVTLEFTNSTYFATVAEGLPPGTFVVIVSAKLNDSISATTSYFISDVQVPFEVNSTNGEVRLKTEVDREKRDLWVFQVGASDSQAQGGAAYALITVLISDVNDEKPVFTSVTNERGEFEAKVLAGSPAGTIVACVGATDGDQPNSNNSLVRYSISGSGLLAIDSVTGQITTIGYIRKGLKQLTASVAAADQGSPPQNSSLTLVVAVEEAADVTLEFTNSTYFATVAEGLPPGTFVVTVSAKLNDSISATTSYFIPDVQVPFEVNSTNGEVSLRMVVDREERDSWIFQIGASDSQAQGGATYALVVIRINDVNDCDPQFQGIMNEQGEYEAKILIGSPAGVFLASVHATDRDQPGSNNSLVTYSISDSNLLNIDANTGRVTTAKAIDRGVQNFSLIVTAFDHGVPQRNKTTVLKVYIAPTSEAMLEFERTSYYTELEEEQHPGYSVLNVSINSASGVSPAAVRYYLVDESVPFAINNLTGEITVRSRVDREQQALWMLLLSATDNSFPERVAYATVNVQVLDINDNDPRFIKAPAQAILNEGDYNEYPLVNVFAEDPDAGDNAMISYGIAKGNDDAIFSILVNGTLYVNGSVRHKTEYILILIAFDHGTTSRQSSTVLFIKVLEANSTNLSFGKVLYGPTVVNENHPVGAVVEELTVSITDGVHFSITGANEDGFFSLNKDTGTIILVKPLNETSETLFTLSVKAEVMTDPTITALAVVQVRVRRSAPVFTKSTYRISVPEDEKVPFNVTTVQAVPSDNRVVEYFIMSGNQDSTFEIDKQTGLLTCVKKVDREATSSYKLTIRASYRDEGTHLKVFKRSAVEEKREFNDAIIEVTVNDVNDEIPTFLKEHYEFVVNGNITAGSLIGTVQAEDHDECKDIEFSLNSPQLFAVNPRSGMITLNANTLNTPSTSFIVEAFDKCPNSRGGSGKTRVTVTVAPPLTETLHMEWFSWSTPAEVEKVKDKLSKILEYDIKIEGVEPPTKADNSLQVKIYAIKESAFVPTKDLRSAIEKKKTELDSYFDSIKVENNRSVASDGGNSTLAIVLGSLAGLLALLCFVLTVLLCKRRAATKYPKVADEQQHAHDSEAGTQGRATSPPARNQTQGVNRNGTLTSSSAYVYNGVAPTANGKLITSNGTPATTKPHSPASLRTPSAAVGATSHAELSAPGSAVVALDSAAAGEPESHPRASMLSSDPLAVRATVVGENTAPIEVHPQHPIVPQIIILAPGEEGRDERSTNAAAAFREDPVVSDARETSDGGAPGQRSSAVHAGEVPPVAVEMSGGDIEMGGVDISKPTEAGGESTATGKRTDEELSTL